MLPSKLLGWERDNIELCKRPLKQLDHGYLLTDTTGSKFLHLEDCCSFVEATTMLQIDVNRFTTNLKWEGGEADVTLSPSF